MTHPIMEIAWRDFVLWASNHKGIVADFNADTGRAFMAPAKCALDSMIDAATGKDADDARAFVHWVTINWWGIDDAPDKIRAEIIAAQGKGPACHGVRNDRCTCFRKQMVCAGPTAHATAGTTASKESPNAG